MTLHLSEGMIARSFWEELNSSLVEEEASREARRILEDSRAIEAREQARSRCTRSTRFGCLPITSNRASSRRWAPILVGQHWRWRAEPEAR